MKKADLNHLRRLMQKPGDSAVRAAYAAWLKEQQDPRAEYLKLPADLGRLNYVDWLVQDGHLDFYLKEFPEVKKAAKARDALLPKRM